MHLDGLSYVVNGSFKGQMLAEVLKVHAEYLGAKVENGELPVLVKFIDAKEYLSVHVNPNDAYTQEHEWGIGCGPETKHGELLLWMFPRVALPMQIL